MMKKTIIILIALAFCLAFLIEQNKEEQVEVVCDAIEIPQTLPAVKEQILVRKAYTVSYNSETKCPNWVAWHLTAEHADGEVERDKNFYEDLDVPEPRATNEDYRGSGWSKGHMCPAGDNKWDAEAMSQSNLLTNMLCISSAVPCCLTRSTTQ